MQNNSQLHRTLLVSKSTKNNFRILLKSDPSFINVHRKALLSVIKAYFDLACCGSSTGYLKSEVTSISLFVLFFSKEKPFVFACPIGRKKEKSAPIFFVSKCHQEGKLFVSCKQ